MGKKKNTLGKLLAFTTTVAAIGGTCYIFRDKIKQSAIYKTAADKCSDLLAKWKDTDYEDDDFFFEDEEETFNDVFSDEEKKNREYTSITITSNEAAEEPKEEPIPTISFETDKEEPVLEEAVSEGTVKEETVNNEVANEKSEVLGYENEGLSDVSEDPEVLEEQDQLDF